jgi:NAD(P)-dependent dehydrogenase (short-subunit alcohol dehydrogenase family)
VVLITGSKRIGARVGERFAEAGAHVALAYNRSRREAEEAAERIRTRGRRAIAVQADVANPADCSRLIETAVAELGRLDVLVNMASLYRAKAFDELTVADWDAQLHVDLRGAYLCARAAVPHMRRAGGGRIINCADWVAASGRPRYFGFLPYFVAKRGVMALTEALALEVARDQILVNCIAPGPILAPSGTSTGQLRAVEQATPLRRWGGEEEIAKAALFLVEVEFVTGETMRVDGGRHVK